MPEWKDVVAIGLRFPEVSEGTSFGNPALRVNGKAMCRMRTNPDAFVVRVLDIGDKAALMQGNPDVYWETPHYEGWPYVLVHLDRIDPAELEELVEDAWRIQAPKRAIKAYESA